jgi:GNAT superfamily N-acetyltransferase
VLALNRVLGLGVREAPGEGTIDEIVSFYRARGVPRFFVQLAPTEAGDALAARLAARGLVHHNNWVRLYRGPLSGEPPAPPAPLRIEAIGPERATAFAECVGAAFGWPPALVPWTAAAVGRPGWRHYLALDDERAVGTGALFVQGPVAWLGMASTAPEYRGRGVQNALIARRLRAATALGCVDLHLETAECKPGKRAPSYHNALRQGFREVYRRRNFLWKAAG